MIMGNHASKYHGNAGALSHLPRKTTEEEDDWLVEEIKSTESKLSVHPLQLAELERLQEAIQSFHVSYILSCMVDQQRKILQRSFDIIVPNVKS